MWIASGAFAGASSAGAFGAAGGPPIEMPFSVLPPTSTCPMLIVGPFAGALVGGTSTAGGGGGVLAVVLSAGLGRSGGLARRVLDAQRAAEDFADGVFERAVAEIQAVGFGRDDIQVAARDRDGGVLHGVGEVRLILLVQAAEEAFARIPCSGGRHGDGTRPRRVRSGILRLGARRGLFSAVDFKG